MDNPIIDNRIVKDMTFALRFLSFAKKIECADACGEDEKKAMISYAKSLLKHQIQTATDPYEIEYLERCKAKERLLNL